MRPTASKLLRSARLPGLLVTNLTNIRYLSGCKMSAGLLLVAQGRYTLFVDSRYTEYANEHAPKDVRVKDIAALEKVFLTLKRCGFEADDVTVARLDRIKKKIKKTTFVPRSGVVEEFRRSKSPAELRSLSRARKLTQEIIKAVPAMLKPGVSEADIAWQMETLARKKGGQGMSFESIVAFGPNSSRPHHRAGAARLKKGDIVQIDCGVIVDGYCGDLSEVFFTAEPTTEQKKILAVLRNAMRVTKAMMKHGADNRKIDAASRTVLKKAGLDEYFTHALGHGVGLDVHEGATLSSRAPLTRLVKGEVVTLEPGVYFPGKFGMRLEDMYVVS